MNNKLKIIATVSFILTSLALLFAYNSPAKGYELSVYESTPVLTWICIILSLVLGTILIIYEVYSKEYTKSNFWIMGFALIILNRIAILSIPFIRGYYSWNADQLTHLGYVRDTLNSGYISDTDFYPIAHILVSQIILITKLAPEMPENYGVIIFSVLSIIFVYLISRITISKEAQLLCVASICGIFFTGWDATFTPQGWSVLYLPVVLFVFIKILKGNKQQVFGILFFIILILLTFFHPLTSLLTISMMIVFGIVISLHNEKKISLKSLTDIKNLKVIYIIFPIMALAMWITTYYRFQFAIVQIYDRVSGVVNSPSMMSYMTTSLNKTGISGFDFIWLIIKMYGHNLILLVIFSICLIILIKYPRKINKYIASLIIFILLMAIVYPIDILGLIPGSDILRLNRIFGYIFIFIPVLSGFLFALVFNKKRLIPHLILVIIISATIISIFNLYPSPYVLFPNSQVTHMDVKGEGWLVNNKNIDYQVTYISSPPYRYADRLLGVNGELKRTDLYQYNTQVIDDHFDYNITEYLGNNYKNTYIAIPEYDRVVYSTVWKSVGRFDDEDFKMLSNDITVTKIHSNGECNLWFIS